MKYKIEFNKDECKGCGACLTCDNWEFDNSNEKVRPIKTTLDEVGCNQDAADICPVQIIKIVEVKE